MYLHDQCSLIKPTGHVSPRRRSSRRRTDPPRSREITSRSREIILDPATLTALALAVGLGVYVVRRALHRGRLDQAGGRHVALGPNLDERRAHAGQGRGSMLML